MHCIALHFSASATSTLVMTRETLSCRIIKSLAHYLQLTALYSSSLHYHALHCISFHFHCITLQFAARPAYTLSCGIIGDSWSLISALRFTEEEEQLKFSFRLPFSKVGQLVSFSVCLPWVHYCFLPEKSSSRDLHSFLLLYCCTVELYSCAVVHFWSYTVLHF